MTKGERALHIHEVFSSQYEDRLPDAVINTIIIHSMYDPGSEDVYSPESCMRCLEAHGVSAHYLIARDGTVIRCVPEEKKAWHAGESRIPDPPNSEDGVNNFSVGIELIGDESSGFTDSQYTSLALLSREIITHRPIHYVYGHADIAPARKSDPWNFDWSRYRRDLKSLLGFVPEGFRKGI